nr:unnamed protein product [Callosobruchus analis]
MGYCWPGKVPCIGPYLLQIL